VSTLVIDASIAVKWIVEEEGTPQALILREKGKLIAPELLVAECAIILWKKVQRNEVSQEEALFGAKLLQGADIELLPMRSLFEIATRTAIELDHPAYDCIYLALAIENECPFVTADERLLRKIGQARRPTLRRRAISLADAVRG
jgi:predicted nucleic acid-binding protein